MYDCGWQTFVSYLELYRKTPTFWRRRPEVGTRYYLLFWAVGCLHHSELLQSFHKVEIR